MRPRDNQRSRCYEWERIAVRALMGRSIESPEFDKIAECEAFALPIWAAERGRVGLAGVSAPTVESSTWGQRAARGGPTKITLPRWARSRWVILHEMAHGLTPRDEAHGPRFVGCLIGLVARHIDLDANVLMQLADEQGLKYHVRTIGPVRVWGPTAHVRRALQQLPRPMSAMDLACTLSLIDGVDITATQVRGAALTLIRAGEARWLRGRLTPTAALVPPTPPAAERANIRRGPTSRERLLAAARAAGVTWQRLYSGGWTVWPGVIASRNDPFDGDHYCADWNEAVARIRAYLEPQPMRIAA